MTIFQHSLIFSLVIFGYVHSTYTLDNLFKMHNLPLPSTLKYLYQIIQHHMTSHIMNYEFMICNSMIQ